MSTQPLTLSNQKTIFISNIDMNTTEVQLFKHLSQLGHPIQSIQIQRDSEKYTTAVAFVITSTHKEAEDIINKLNGTKIKGSKNNLKLNWDLTGIADIQSNESNLYVKGIKKSIDQQHLFNVFSSYGTILSCKLSINNREQSNGYAYVRFVNVEDAMNVMTPKIVEEIKKLIGEDNFTIEKYSKPKTTPNTNIFIENIDEQCTEEEFITYFKQFGTIASINGKLNALFVYDESHQKNKGYITYSTREEAQRAIDKSNGRAIVGDSKIHSCFHLSKKDRFEEIKKKNAEIQHNARTMYSESYLYIKADHYLSEDEIIKKLGGEKGVEHFYTYSIKKIRGKNSNVAYVCFYTVDDASVAIKTCEEMGWSASIYKPSGKPSQQHDSSKGFLPYMEVMMPLPFQIEPVQHQQNKTINKKKGESKQPKQVQKTNITDDMINDLGDSIYLYIEGLNEYDEETIGKITGVLLDSIDYHQLNNKLKNPKAKLLPLIREAASKLKNLK
ncbi:Polyadenylate-binding protein [Entamoeba marina]